jgi:two-component system, OmpR family, sensor kinase
MRLAVRALPRPRMRRRITVGTRTRILASYVVLLSFSALLAVLVIGRVLDARVEDRVLAAQRQEVDELRLLARDCRVPATGRPCPDLQTIFDVFLARNIPATGETLYGFIGGRLVSTVSSASGGRTRPGNALRRLGRVTRSETGRLDTPSGSISYLAVPVRRGSAGAGAFVVTTGLDAERADVDDALTVVVATEVGVLLLGSLLAWAIAGRVLAPVRELRDTARSIGETDLTRRIPVRGLDELAELARTFNGMLDRLEAAFASQRDFVNDASHELRTPITIVRGHLELMGDEPAERQETVALVTDELDRMSRFVDDLLLLAKAGRTDFLDLETVPLDQLTDELLAKARGLGARDWQLDARATGRLVADRQRLTQAMMGLAQNATQHTEPGTTIAIGTALERDHARLWVRDEGPGIPAAEQGRIFERFARVGDGRRRSEGAGLGLAIVRAIAEAHGGRVELASRAGAGATFTLVLPLDPPEVS